MKKSINVFYNWYQRNYEKIVNYNIFFPCDAIHGTVKIIGNMKQIDYISDKWYGKGNNTYYFHPLEIHETARPLIISFILDNKKCGFDDKKSRLRYIIAGKQPSRVEGLVEIEKLHASVGKIPPTPKSCVLLGELKLILLESNKIMEFTECNLLCDQDAQWLYINFEEDNPKGD